MPNDSKKIWKTKTLKFKDHPEFTPNLTPKQVLQGTAPLKGHIIGIFGSN